MLSDTMRGWGQTARGKLQATKHAKVTCKMDNRYLMGFTKCLMKLGTLSVFPTVCEFKDTAYITEGWWGEPGLSGH